MYGVNLNNESVNEFDTPSEAEDFATDLRADVVPGFNVNDTDVVSFEDENGWHIMHKVGAWIIKK